MECALLSADQTSLGRQLKSAYLTPQQTSHTELRPALTLRELPPCPLCGPPYEPAPADNKHAQRNPSINACGNDPHAQREDRYDHRKIIRTGIAAVRAVAPPRIQDARRAHPDEGDDPDHGAKGYRNKQTGKKMTALGIHHASKLVCTLPSQSREVWVGALVIARYAQQEAAPGSPERTA